MTHSAPHVFLDVLVVGDPVSQQQLSWTDRADKAVCVYVCVCSGQGRRAKWITGVLARLAVAP